MSSSNALKVGLVVVIVAVGLFLSDDLGSKMGELAALNVRSGVSKTVDPVLPDPKLQAKHFEELRKRKQLRKDSLNFDSNSNGENTKNNNTNIRRVDFKKYEYEIVKYKRHNPYREDLSDEVNRLKFKSYDGKRFGSIQQEVEAELESMAK
ncbi:MAG: hypothetical protein CL677_02825 [Bdellovibrionaceae bacterium]|nr:hypothetical protein [Pseudobdellovibrionaceae bacterium]